MKLRTYILAGNYKMLDALIAERDTLRSDSITLKRNAEEFAKKLVKLREEHLQLQHAYKLLVEKKSTSSAVNPLIDT